MSKNISISIFGKIGKRGFVVDLNREQQLLVIDFIKKMHGGRMRAIECNIDQYSRSKILSENDTQSTQKLHKINNLFKSLFFFKIKN